MKAPDPRQLLVLFVPWEWGWRCCAGGSEGTDPSPGTGTVSLSQGQPGAPRELILAQMAFPPVTAYSHFLFLSLPEGQQGHRALPEAPKGM